MANDTRIKIEGDIPSLDAAWDDGTNAYMGPQIEAFVKKLIRELQKSKIGADYSTHEGGMLHYYTFASKEDKTAWLEDPDASQDLVLSHHSWYSQAVAESYTMSARVAQTPATTVVKGAGCLIVFTYDCYFGSDTTDKDTEQGYAQVTVNGARVTALDLSLTPDGRTHTIDVGPYLTQETNTVKLTVGNQYGDSRTWSFTISAVELNLSLDASYDESVLRTSNWAMRVRCQGVTADVHMLLDGEEYAAATVANSTYDFVMDAANTLSAGSHKVQLYAENKAYGLVTETITTYFIKGGSGVTSVGIGADADASIKLYDTLSVPYFFHSPGAPLAEITVKFEIRDLSGATIATPSDQTVTTKSDGTSGMQELRYSMSDPAFLNDDGAVDVVIKVGTASATHRVEVTDAGVTLEAASECKVHLSAAGKTNADADAENWGSEYNGSLTCQVVRSDNFKLNSSNGFVGDAYVIKSGRSVTLTECQPFATDFGVNSALATQRTGKTIEFEFKTTNCVKSDALIISCMNGGVGFQIYANRAVLSCVAGTVETRFTEEERLRIGFCIDGSTTHCVNALVDGTEESDCNIAYMYVNGVICRLMDYGSSAWKQPTAQDIEIGSEYCDVELYAVRIYDKSLTPSQMLGNYAFDTPDIDEKIKIATRNAILDSAGAVDYAKVLAALPSTPYKIWELDRMPTGKKDWVKCNTEFVNPQWSEALGKVKISFICKQHDIALDGTSSLSYPDPYKNWADKYNGTWTITIGGVETVITTYSITEGIEDGENQFVDKVNFASSEGIGNILAMNAYQKILLGAASQYPNLLTPQQKEQLAVGTVTYRHSLSGFPIIGYLRAYTNGVASVKFLSIYNFINNKYSPSIFGFPEDGTSEAWEVEDNVNFFMDQIAEGSYSGGKWNDQATTLYYARVPKTSPVTGNDYGTASAASQVTQALSESAVLRTFHNWVQSCNPTVAERYRLKNGSYQKLASTVTYGDSTFSYDTPEYRIAKFNAEHASYLCKESAMFYFLFCNYILGTDSMDKNMTLAFPNKGACYIFLRDTDTVCQYNNRGVLAFLVFHEWGDSYDESTGETGAVSGETYDATTGAYSVACTAGSPVFNGRLSGLWDCVSQAWASDLKSMYQAMRSNGLNANDLMALYNEFWEQWSEALYNADGMGYANTGRFDMAHGDKREVFKAFFKQRQTYMDSKYEADTSTALELRLWGSGNGVALRYSVPIYASLNWGAGGIQTVRAINPGEPALFPSTGATFNETTFTIYFANYLTEVCTYVEGANGATAESGLQDISTSCDITGLEKCLKLTRLVLDYSEKNANTNLTARVLNVSKSVALEELVIRNCPNVTGALDLSSQQIRSVDLRATGVTAFSCPETETLTTLYLPSTIKTLKLEGLGKLSDLTLEGVSNLTELAINDCPLIDSRELLERILGTKGNQLAKVTMHDVDWDEFSVDYLAALGEIESDITGTITYASLSFSQKYALVAALGDIDDETRKLKIVYPKKSLTAVAISGVDFVADYDPVQFSVSPTPTTGNNFKSVKWGLTSTQYAAIDETTGVFTAKEVFTADDPHSVTVTLTVTMTDGTQKTAEKQVALYERDVEVGDAVYADGSTSAADSIDENKTLVGYCWWINPDDRTERLCVMKDYLNSNQTVTWGPNSNVTLSDQTLTPDIGLIMNNGSCVNPTASNYLDSSQKDGFAAQNILMAGLDYGFMNLVQDAGDGVENNYSAGDRIPVGLAYTLEIIKRRNLILGDSSFSGATIPTNCGDSTLTALQLAYQLAPSAAKIYYFLAASYCYSYQPSVKTGETLSPKFKQGKWFLPTAGDVARIYYWHNKRNTEGTPFYAPTQSGKLAGFGTNNHWTSSENGNTANAWVMQFSNGTFNVNNNKTYSYCIRAVAAF
ncbi:MAG: hypothetical protein LIP02_09515 [Bacteroidales bacterium]|nr:hypothetical protein [Bacteroidales bacterium]